MSRKYGVINVFSSGNGESNPFYKNEWINNMSLSFNSIIVGALNDTNDSVSYYSNWRINSNYKDISKPFVLAPGTFSYFNNRLLNELGHKRLEENITNNEFIYGTSFAAPTVSGAISLFLSLPENKDINNNIHRVQSIKSIIASSSNEYYKFWKNAKSKRKLKTYNNFKDELNKNYVYQSDKFLFKKDKKISIALSWLFNSGLLKETEIIKEKVNIGLYLTGRFPIYEANYKMHKNEKELLKYETFRRQENRFFSDYDLYLQKENSDGNWENIKVSNSITFND
ncbi:S8 family serine peptidase [Mycoplasmopsis felis]|uniref:S8 family serine peptidase n=1 Tax=Mycoplasmopsis felis TaxID=33923 RepID=UPI002AF6AC5E|nr:S8 family serine peptidase [Mycoplasmopsis felis]WQQ02860.1 S8 family serine peptidase [Mycoplasmopsis felis]